MILDNNTLFGTNVAFTTVSGSELNLESVSGGVGPGSGEPIKCFIQGSGLLGATGFTVSDGSVSGTLSVKVTNVTTDIIDGMVSFDLPSDILQFVNVGITGTLTAGSWSAGVVFGNAQTAK